MFMKSNEPLDDEGMNPYLESTLKSLGFSAASELGFTAAHRLTKNSDNLNVAGIHEGIGDILYNEKIKHEDMKDLLEKFNFNEDRAEKLSHKIADSKVANFFTAGMSTTKGRINNYGLGVLGGLVMTAISENNKDNK